MSETPAAYRVLARKYRPAAFADLIGQEALVRILTNAIRTGRIAHAFMLTGVRGVGKTTTARILARALNCRGPDGKREEPAEEPCGVCEACTAIADDRHVDVIEMDAASHTGVDDVREIIEAARYRPVSARFKVYIVDEVHMLSRQAFNALLKTLEEPPGHVKFIFATTEIRRVPVTVLSRCQRFDLRRVPVELLETHFQGVVAREGAEIEPEALARIARAADGSVRDGLSMLDQAITEADGGRIAGRRRERDAGPFRQARHLRPVRGADARRTCSRTRTIRRDVPGGRRSGPGAAGHGGAGAPADARERRAGGGGGRRAAGSGAGARPQARRSLVHAGAHARVATRAEGHPGGEYRAVRQAGFRDGAAAHRLCREPADAGRSDSPASVGRAGRAGTAASEGRAAAG